MKPLLGPVKSTLAVFRPVREGDEPERIVRKTVATDKGNVIQEIYREFEEEIYPTESIVRLSMPWGELIKSPPPSFTQRDLKENFSLNLQKFNKIVEQAIEDQIKTNAHTRAVAILERHGEIPCYPSHSALKNGTGPRMLDGRAADGPYAPSDADSQSPPRKKRKD
ncbi:hypothetical protein VTN77DRAFT_5319 [Rasamsonia byssochlamydoides]|uniref:uncharacterized protein n=1 Tax=Rasamsonia byssochlamydoides TaxID=89139 RepID=UPI0037430BB4